MSLSFNIPYAGVKLLSTAVLLAITLAFSYLPFFIKRRVRRSGLVMSYCNSLAGGIVLGALLMHMIPEMMEGDGYCEHSAPAIFDSAKLSISGVPLGQIKMAANAAASDLHLHKHTHVNDKKHDASHSHDCKDHSHFHGHGEQASVHSQDNHEHSHGFAWGPFWAGTSFLILFAVDRLFLTHSHCDDAHPKPKENIEKTTCSHSHHDGPHDHHHENLSIQPDAEHGSCHEDDVIAGCHSDGINAAATKTQTFVFVLALSVHSLLEGFGMANKNNTSSLASFLISLFAHKWLEAFALGAGVVKACFNPWHSFFLIMLYSILTPLGIIVGMSLEAFANTNLSAINQTIVKQILDGLALGSFLFVSCIEMIPSEFHKTNKHTPFKFAMLCLGFFSMAIISIFHSH